MWDMLLRAGIVSGIQKKLTIAQMQMFLSKDDVAKQACRGKTKRADLIGVLNELSQSWAPESSE